MDQKSEKKWASKSRTGIDIDRDLKIARARLNQQTVTCNPFSQRVEILEKEKYIYEKAKRKDIYGSFDRERIIAKACRCFRWKAKTNPKITIEDVCNFLVHMYCFHPQARNEEEITRATLEVGVKKMCAGMNLPADPLSDRKSFF